MYGHYDVQPADRGRVADGLRSHRRSATGRIYGRGVSDNKAPIMITLNAVRACRELYGSVPCHLST